MKIPCLLFLATLSLTSAARAATTGPCAPSAFLTFESGTLAGVDWVDQGPMRIHTRSELTQSAVIDATVDLRDDQSAMRSSTTFTPAGSTPQTPVVKSAGPGVIFWSDMVPSSVQLAIARARALDRPVAHVEAASFFSDSHGVVDITRVDATDWVVAYHNKSYQVLTDDRGCMLSASLPDFGVTIERRTGLSPNAYPLWAPYAAPPDGAYVARDVAISAAQGRILAGTLTAPLHPSKAPAVVLITGLSPHERNNGQPPWMPFRDIADSLTRAGIAVLRFDDRGIGKSTGDNSTFTSFDKADDIRSEVEWLRTQPGIDPSRIALVGYSEGGLIAPMVAASDPKIAAVITLAGPGVSGPEVARYQIEAAVDNDPSIAPADREKEIQRQLAEPLTSHERSYMSIDPMEYARRVRCPALIIQGSTDLNIPVRSAQRIADAMRSNGNPDVTIRLFAQVNHALLPDTSGLDDGWVTLPAFITSPQVLDEVTRWASAHLL